MLEIAGLRTTAGGAGAAPLVVVLLRGSRPVDGLVLMSASRIACADWELKRERLRGLPAFLSHGRADRDLAFAAGEALRDFVLAGGAEVSWVPFEGGHETPLVVWRGLRKFLGGLLKMPRKRDAAPDTCA